MHMLCPACQAISGISSRNRRMSCLYLPQAAVPRCNGLVHPCPAEVRSVKTGLPAELLKQGSKAYRLNRSVQCLVYVFTPSTLGHNNMYNMTNS